MTPITTVTDLTEMSAPAAAVQGATNTQRQKACDRANAVVCSKLVAAGYVMPLLVWEADLTGYASDIAWWFLLKLIGMSVDDPGAAIVKTGHDEAMKWLDLVIAGKARPSGIIDSDPAVDEAAPIVDGPEPRGWTDV